MESENIEYSQLWSEYMHSNNWTQLHMATINGDIEKVKFILNSDISNLNTVDIANQSPLHFAVLNERYEIIEILLKYGANTNIKNSNGYSPLDYAKCNSSDIILSIFNSHVNPDPKFAGRKN